ncbi:oligopeptide-binding protein OppA [Bifidobacterium actinocoloniiforme DSM 22766]|uniref:Oligopeptide-binding protein OppA n=1 Tax=Bifidobacterium actinocoloniiforme DSM 22766 TaxID=1437605 RepID=A0A086Z0W4_9BIFI|nr:ABC transporter substrate-binding protein [Bifidobacterium actinocoloniiforme]AKV55354.1 ABC transporter substrate-binding protein [Bifidobacterium actinocoloniiforme DSM 22766]KFI40164.1 oligopeptide-binding protein OppA [Bifidobacterium actinocoloniiforme DSM 22766]
MHNTKQKITITAAACIVALSLGACGSASEGSDSSAKSDSNAIITAFDTEPQNGLIPGDTNERGGGRPSSMLFSGLVGVTPDGKSVNEVADSITPSADKTQYTVKLKPGWKFSDGSPVKASSFTKAWSYTANAVNAQKGSSFLSLIKGYDELQDTNIKSDAQLSGLKVIDDLTFTVDLTQPDSVFPIKVGYDAFFPLPESFYKDPKGFGEHPVGNGPYKFQSWEHNKSIQLVKNPYYKGQFKPRNGGITFKIYTSTDAAYADIQAGNLDLMENVPASASKTFTSDTNVQSFNKAGSSIAAVALPSNLEHFKEDQEGILRRQAISMSIDRESICKKVLNGTASPAASYSAPTIPGYTTDLENSGNIKYNPKKAKELWDQANKISKIPADYKLTFSYNADETSYKSVYKAVANMVKSNLGIDTEDVPVATFQEYRQNVTARKMTGAFHAGWTPDYPSVENYLHPIYASDSADGKGANDTDYKNPEFDDLIKQSAKAADSKEENALYAKAQGILLRDMPGIPLYYLNRTGAASKQVKDFTMSWQNYPVYWMASVTSK